MQRPLKLDESTEISKTNGADEDGDVVILDDINQK